MADFASAEAKLDSAVDRKLGDVVLYKRHGVDADFVERRGFLTFDMPQGGSWSPRDSAKGITRLKIGKDIVPRPTTNDRIQAPKLDGTYRPINGDPTSMGRHWLVDLQKVS